jgi:streptogramin lyase
MPNIFNRYISLLVFFFICNMVFGAGNLYPEPASYRFSQITINEGLSHNNIECIFKDSDGFLWIGTRNGLCRFDGYQMKIYRSGNDSNSLSGDRILCINEDNFGNLWIGTYSRGLNALDRKTGKFKNFNHFNLLRDRINRISVFRDGSVWICSNNGLAHYVNEKDSFRIFRASEENATSLNSDYINDIIETREGDIYVATLGDAIQHFDREKEVFTEIYYKRSPELQSNYRKRLLEDSNGLIWIAADLHGLCSYNPETVESRIYLNSEGQLNTNTLTGDMALDPDQNIWLCTDGGGINIVDPRTGTFRYLVKDESRKGSLSTDHIYTIYFDELNTAWVGTFNPERLSDWNWGERYGESVIHDLNNSAVGWIDWNILLDETGGPNHVANYCYVPVIANTKTGQLVYMNSYYYLGHFSKFIHTGAKRILCSSNHDDLLATAFVNPDGNVVVVIMNQTARDMDFRIWIRNKGLDLRGYAHSIATIIFN